MKENDRFSREFEVLLLDNRNYETAGNTKTLAYWVQETLNMLNNAGLALNGQLDEATKSALRAFQSKQGLAANGIADPVTERLLIEERALKSAGFLKASLVSGIIQEARTKIEDWTARATPPKDENAHLVTSEYRNLKNVWALVLHHMAFKRRNKSKEYSDPESYLRTRAHFCIMFDGRIIQLYPISRKIWHSNCTSPGSVGVEFEGNFPNIEGRWWYPKDKETGRITARDEDHPTKAQIEAGRFLVQYLQAVAGFKEVLAHRQSSDTRSNDPGPDVWYNVGQWSVNNLSIGDGGGGFKCGDGKPIPPDWRNWHDRNLIDGVIPVVTPRPSTSGSTTTSNQASGGVPKVHQSNRYYAEKLGWDAYRVQIYPLLGYPNSSPTEELFAEAVANWQRQNGFSTKDSDGILGPRSWEKMKQVLGIATMPTSGPSVGSPQSTATTVTGNTNMELINRLVGIVPVSYNKLPQTVAGLNAILNQGADANKLADVLFYAVYNDAPKPLTPNHPLASEWVMIKSKVQQTLNNPAGTGQITSLGKLGKLIVDTSMTALSKSIPEYQFTTNDALWLARFVEGEAGGRNDLDNHAVIWAMFNRYGAFRQLASWGSFGSFIQSYSTTLQPILKSVDAAKRVWDNHNKNPQKFPVTVGNGFYDGTNIKKVQYKKHTDLQKKTWSQFSPTVQNLILAILRGQIANPGIGMASDFASTKILFTKKYGRPPSQTEWLEFTQKYKANKATWIGEVPNINQMKNAFFLDNRLKNVPSGSIRVVV